MKNKELKKQKQIQSAQEALLAWNKVRLYFL